MKNERLPKNRFDRVASICGIISAGVGVLGLVGWVLGARILAAVRMDYIPMAPNTGLIIFLLGFSLCFLTTWPGHRVVRIAVAGITVFCAIIAGLTLAGIAAGVDSRVDYVLINASGSVGSVPVGRMSPVTAACFLAVCAALLLLLENRRDPAALLGTAIAGSAGIILIGYWYGAPLLYGGTIIPVALTTAMALGVLGIGLTAAAGPASWPLSSISGPSTRARLLRALCPAILVVVVIVDWINVSLIDPADSTVVLLSAIMALITLLVVYLVVSYVSRNIGDAIDRSERERGLAEIALRESEERFRMLLLHVPSVAVQGYAMDGTTQYWNEASEHLYGYTAEEAIGRNILELIIPPEMRDGVREAILGMVKTGEPIPSAELSLMKKDGSRVEVFSSHALIHKPGRPMELFCIDVDISCLKRAEALRERLISELEKKNTELDRFTYTVSHDLKSPLISIRAYLNLLDEDLKSGDVAQAERDIVRISESAEKLEQLITTLLVLSRSGKTVTMPSPVPFGDLARESAGLLQPALEKRRIILEIPDDLPVVYGDRQRLLQVMTNLFDNAIKFMGDQPDPRIVIGVEEAASGRVFFVRDNGMGILAEHLPKVFDLFERFNPGIPGTGIGLATVKRIIEAHGGTIRAESEGPGQGTTVRFTLPGTGVQSTDKDNIG